MGTNHDQIRIRITEIGYKHLKLICNTSYACDPLKRSLGLHHWPENFSKIPRVERDFLEKILKAIQVCSIQSSTRIGTSEHCSTSFFVNRQVIRPPYNLTDGHSWWQSEVSKVIHGYYLNHNIILNNWYINNPIPNPVHSKLLNRVHLSYFLGPIKRVT